DAADLEAIRGLLIVKDGILIAERYFNEGAVNRPTLVQSVTKSVTSALVGIALEKGCLEGIDQPMLDFFPEQAVRVRDPRKREITLRQMLQMRAGYGWEGSDSLRWEGLIGGDYLPLLVDFPLDRDPGTGFDYSNVTSHLLAVIVSRACDSDLLELARADLFGPIGVEPGDWGADPEGYRYGQGELHLTARDMARLGLLYLNRGAWKGRQVVPADWVEASLTGYSSDIDTAGLRSGTVGRYFHDAEYGYQWWSARVGDRRFDFAWGHGGQMILLLHDLDMILIVTTDPFHRPIREDHEAWTHEQATFNLIGKFIASLPAEGAG
ncbi:MAG: serine hydrolase, partial [Gemmatimonadota bacterium]